MYNKDCNIQYTRDYTGTYNITSKNKNMYHA